MGEGICALLVFPSSSPAALPHGVTQSGWGTLLLFASPGSGDNTLACFDSTAKRPTCEALSLVLKPAVDQAGFRFHGQQCGPSLTVTAGSNGHYWRKWRDTALAHGQAEIPCVSA